MKKTFFLESVFLWSFVVISVGFSQAHAFDSGIIYDQNVSASLKKQVESDLEAFSKMSGAQQSPLHEKIFEHLDGAGYIRWFKDRVKNFGVDRCGGASAVACYKSSSPKKIWVAANYIQGNYPQMGRLMTLVHEARHTEEQWPHYNCPKNFPYRSIWTGKKLAGKAACDITAFGSYGVASILMNNVSRFCENCNEKIKLDAKIYSDDQVKRITNKSAAQQMLEDFTY